MALRRIVLDGEEVLRLKSKVVKDFNENLWLLLDDMYETMIQAQGVGIAAPQVGILKRAVIIDAHNMKLELINPQIVNVKGTQLGEEGCLSVKNVRGEVERPFEITVKAQNRYGKPFTITVCDFPARALCHEIDHLNGILFIDVMKREIKG